MSSKALCFCGTRNCQRQALTIRLDGLRHRGPEHAVPAISDRTDVFPEQSFPQLPWYMADRFADHTPGTTQGSQFSAQGVNRPRSFLSEESQAQQFPLRSKCLEYDTYCPLPSASSIPRTSWSPGIPVRVTKSSGDRPRKSALSFGSLIQASASASGNRMCRALKMPTT